MKNQKDLELVNNKELREQTIAHVEVLDKVKKLLMVEELGMATAQQVANYYGVDRTAILKVVDRNEDEVLSDGYKVFTKEETKNLLSENLSLKTKRGGFDVDKNDKSHVDPKQ